MYNNMLNKALEFWTWILFCMNKSHNLYLMIALKPEDLFLIQQIQTAI